MDTNNPQQSVPNKDEQKLVEPKSIKRYPCRSSSLAQIGYDKDSRILEVVFTTGGTFRYYGVSATLWENLIHASSMGGYFSRAIRKGGFRYRRVR